MDMMSNLYFAGGRTYASFVYLVYIYVWISRISMYRCDALCILCVPFADHIAPPRSPTAPRDMRYDIRDISFSFVAIGQTLSIFRIYIYTILCIIDSQNIVSVYIYICMYVCIMASKTVLDLHLIMVTYRERDME